MPAAIDLTPPVPGTDPTVAAGDTMFLRQFGEDYARAHYYQSGRTALRCVRAAVAAAGTSQVRRVLDLPCGYGRILRVLKAAYPDAELTACDLERPAVDFCRDQFGATAVYSDPDPAKVRLAGPFDLIWCGSLLTHLDAPRWDAFLSRFRGLLSADGVCVFTSHGAGAEEFIRAGRSDYGVADPAGLARRGRRRGFAFREYAKGSGYGVSLATVGWVAERVRMLPAARLVAVVEKGWHNHHDVFAFGPMPAPEWERLAA